MENETLSSLFSLLSLIWKLGVFFYPSKGSVPTIAIFTNALSPFTLTKRPTLLLPFFLFYLTSNPFPQLFLIGLHYHPPSFFSLSLNKFALWVLTSTFFAPRPNSYLSLSLLLPSGERKHSEFQ